jgi:hypothetical protein
MENMYIVLQNAKLCSFVEKCRSGRLKRCLHPQGSLKLDGARQCAVLISVPKYMVLHSRRQEDYLLQALNKFLVLFESVSKWSKLKINGHFF